MSNYYDPPAEGMDAESTGAGQPVEGSSAAHPIVIDDDRPGTAENPIILQDDDDSAAPFITAASLDARLIDLTMENEDEVVPPHFWEEAIDRKRAYIASMPMDEVLQFLHSRLQERKAELASQHAAATRDSQASQVQMLRLPKPPTCYYAFVDSIEYRHLGETEPLELQEEAYEENWPPLNGYEALFTLDCFDAEAFLAALWNHGGKFEVLYGATLTAERITNRKVLLAELIKDPSKSCVIRRIIGSNHPQYREAHELLPELRWLKIWAREPEPDELSLWAELAASHLDSDWSYRAVDLFTDVARPVGVRYLNEIEDIEVAYLEEVFSLNHIPDAPLPPATVPGGRTPVDPVMGFLFRSKDDPYWKTDLPERYRTSIMAADIIATESGIARDETTERAFQIVYVKRNFLIIHDQYEVHTLLFLDRFVSVCRAFHAEPFTDMRSVHPRFTKGIVEKGSLLSPDESIVFLYDSVSGQFFVERAISGRRFFISVKHVMHFKKGVQ